MLVFFFLWRQIFFPNQVLPLFKDTPCLLAHILAKIYNPRAFSQYLLVLRQGGTDSREGESDDLFLGDHPPSLCSDRLTLEPRCIPATTPRPTRPSTTAAQRSTTTTTEAVSHSGCSLDTTVGFWVLRPPSEIVLPGEPLPRRKEMSNLSVLPPPRGNCHAQETAGSPAEPIIIARVLEERLVRIICQGHNPFIDIPW